MSDLFEGLEVTGPVVNDQLPVDTLTLPKPKKAKQQLPPTNPTDLFGGLTITGPSDSTKNALPSAEPPVVSPPEKKKGFWGNFTEYYTKDIPEAFQEAKKNVTETGQLVQRTPKETQYWEAPVRGVVGAVKLAGDVGMPAIKLAIKAADRMTGSQIPKVAKNVVVGAAKKIMTDPAIANTVASLDPEIQEAKRTMKPVVDWVERNVKPAVQPVAEAYQNRTQVQKDRDALTLGAAEVLPVGLPSKAGTKTIIDDVVSLLTKPKHMTEAQIEADIARQGANKAAEKFGLSLSRGQESAPVSSVPSGTFLSQLTRLMEQNPITKDIMLKKRGMQAGESVAALEKTLGVDLKKSVADNADEVKRLVEESTDASRQVLSGRYAPVIEKGEQAYVYGKDVALKLKSTLPKNADFVNATEATKDKAFNYLNRLESLDVYKTKDRGGVFANYKTFRDLQTEIGDEMARLDQNLKTKVGVMNRTETVRDIKVLGQIKDAMKPLEYSHLRDLGGKALVKQLKDADKFYSKEAGKIRTLRQLFGVDRELGEKGAKEAQKSVDALLNAKDVGRLEELLPLMSPELKEAVGNAALERLVRAGAVLELRGDGPVLASIKPKVLRNAFLKDRDVLIQTVGKEKVTEIENLLMGMSRQNLDTINLLDPSNASGSGGAWINGIMNLLLIGTPIGVSFGHLPSASAVGGVATLVLANRLAARWLTRTELSAAEKVAVMATGMLGGAGAGYLAAPQDQKKAGTIIGGAAGAALPFAPAIAKGLGKMGERGAIGVSSAMSSLGNALSTVSPETLVRSVNPTARVKQLFGNMSEKRFEALFDGAPFKNVEEEITFSLANKYQSDLEYAVNVRDIKEVEALLNKIKNEYSREIENAQLSFKLGGAYHYVDLDEAFDAARNDALDKGYTNQRLSNEEPIILFPEQNQQGNTGVKMLTGMAGGSLVGGTVGSQIGDTPEERRRNALIGAGVGPIVGVGALSKGVRGETGLIGGRMATGFPSAPRKFSSIVDKMERFEIDDSKAKANRILENTRTSLNKAIKKEHRRVLTIPGDAQTTEELAKLNNLYDERINLRKRNDDGFALPEVLSHKALYDNYPEFKNVKVHFFHNKNSSSRAGVTTSGDIVANSAHIKSGDQLTESLLHEIQHLIQTKEGFSEGTSLSTINNAMVDRRNQLWEMKKALIPSDPNYQAKLLSLDNQIQKTFNRKTDFDIYMATGGEFEARDVSRRWKLSEAERAKTLLGTGDRVKTEDVIPSVNKLLGVSTTGSREQSKPGASLLFEMAVDAKHFQPWKEATEKFETKVASNVMKNISALQKKYEPFEEAFPKAGSASPLKSNADYGVSLDLDELCPRTSTTRAIEEKIGKSLGRLVTRQERAIIIKNLADEGVKAVCPSCYVETPRMISQEVLLGVTKARGINPAVWVDPAIRTEYMASTKDGKKILTELAHSTRQLMAKVEHGFSPVVREILNLNPEKVKKINSHSGLRMQSSTDFKPSHTLDMAQALINMEQKGLMSHAYTKEPDFVELVGNTGVKINMGIFADGTGNKITQSKHGMDWNSAKRLAKKYPDAGVILVAMNDDQVRWGMRQQWVGQIIPVHASGIAKKDMEKLLGEGTTDFTQFQNVRKVSGGKADRTFHSDVHQNNPTKIKEIADKWKKEGVLAPFYDLYGQEPGYIKVVTDISRWDTPQRVIDASEINWEKADALMAKVVQGEGEGLGKVDKKTYNRILHEVKAYALTPEAVQDMQRIEKHGGIRSKALYDREYLKTLPEYEKRKAALKASGVSNAKADLQVISNLTKENEALLRKRYEKEFGKLVAR